MKKTGKNKQAVLVWALAGAVPVMGWVWFGYDPARSEWRITPETITLSQPDQTTQLRVQEFMPDIGQYGDDMTAHCMFWTDNEEWTLTPQGVLSCRVSGPGVVHARLPDGRQLTQTITVDPHLPRRILVPPVAHLSPPPARTLDYYRVEWSIGRHDVHWSARALLAACLQGLVNRRQPRMYLDDQLYTVQRAARDHWQSVLATAGYVFVHCSNLYELVAKYAGESTIRGVALYNARWFHDTRVGDMINYVTTLSGVEDVLPVTPEQYAALTGVYGVALPVRAVMDDAWLAAQGLTNSAAIYAAMQARFWPRCSRRMLAKIHPHLHLYDRDYIVAHKLFCAFWRKGATTAEVALLDGIERALYGHGIIMVDWAAQQTWCDWYYGKVDTVYTNIMTNSAVAAVYEYERDYTNTAIYTPVWDYPRSRFPEYVLTATNALAGVVTAIWVETTWRYATNGGPLYYYEGHDEQLYLRLLARRCRTITYSCGMANLSLHSGLRLRDLHIQPWRPPAMTPASNVIYVTFTWSDGDNLVWNKQLWPEVLAGANWKAHAFGAGFGINPLLCEVAPVMMKWLIEHAPAKVEPMWSGGGVNFTETEHYGADYGAAADQLLREYYGMAQGYWEQTGIRSINPQHYVYHRGLRIAAEVYTNAAVIVPGNVDTYAAAGGTLLTNWLANGVAVIAPAHLAIYSVAHMDYTKPPPENVNRLFSWEADDALWQRRPQYWVVPVLGNRVFPEAGGAEMYYQWIGTMRLFDTRPLPFGWLVARGLLSEGQIRMVSVPPYMLGSMITRQEGTHK